MDTFESQGFQIAYVVSARSHLRYLAGSCYASVVPGFLDYC